jgi:serine/threonine-protein kinase
VPGELDLTGRTLGDFRLLRRLGAGGMGQVYLAEQISLSRNVALKTLRPDLIAAHPEAMERFRLEAKAVARANHANIVQVYTHGEADGIWYIALEYVEGRNLREYLAPKGPPEVLLALSILRQVAAALQRAGELGIVHRDIKPENILLTRKGEVKVADFGLSRCLTGEQPVNLTQSGVTMGTPLYMSPEQVEGKPLDPRTDIYSLGVTCYHMLAGQPPFRGETAFEVALQHVRKEPVPLSQVRPDLPEGLCAIVHKMMAKDPAQRYQTARDLLKDIGRLRESLSGQTGAVAPVSIAMDAGPGSVTRGPASAAALTVVPVTPVGAPTLAALPPAPARSWRALLVVSSLVVAASLGALCAWARRQGPSEAYSAVVPIAEAESFGLQKQEQALRVVAEQYLTRPSGGLEGNLGLSGCLNLGLYYLKHDRLDDALAWFKHLEAQPMQACRSLGYLGRGIVLALQSKARESNQVFKELMAHARDATGKPREIFRGVLLSPDLRFWLIKALEYNRQNGIRDQDVPQRVHVLAYGKARA